MDVDRAGNGVGDVVPDIPDVFTTARSQGVEVVTGRGISSRLTCLSLYLYNS